ncbi:efflux RND transporter periplasmic adaptor subunit [Gluconacetobacter takamatsuzukensis]|uniref:Efflux RND transporter periplasmic adaptor subunit n=1 Tax=Gluconacetobacter takamatsuzukensis TaxID=1286190 RepID=A0A7W4KEQ1_9PROT|nr:efflux RND transporter periplasmic adaptor subunit [Gluconacetobacter takamatsuzukensis]MBB2205561.1 efflux RND transporter periplasmic adaptor subunit [Gluconacetobacter takamatsuzukensis]
MRRVWAGPVLAAALIGPGLSSPVRAEAEGAPAPVTIGAEARRAEGVTDCVARLGALSRTLPVLASVTADETRIVRVRPVGAGKVLRVHVMAGQHVARDSVLVDYLDHSLHVARLQSVQMHAALAGALAAEAEAEAAWRRARDLSGSTVSQGEVRRRLAVLQEARSTVAARQADVGTMTHRFEEEFNSVSERTTTGGDETSSLLAPIDGMVQDLGVSTGGDIEAGQVAATLIDLSSVWIVSDIAPQDAARLVVGGRQTALLDGRRIESRIDSISGAASAATGLVRVISAVPNPDGALRPGMMLDVALETADRKSGIVVPSEAVQQIAGRDMVFVRQGADGYRPVPVTVGIDSGESAVILAGLSAGEIVAAHGSFALKSILLLAGMGGDD